MEPLEDDLEKVFNICDTDGDGLLTKAELEHILQDIGVEQEDIDEFMRGLEAAEINFAMFTDAIEKFRSMGDHSSRFIQSVNSNRSLAGSANSGDHADCNFMIHELNSRNSVLSKQIFALEAQIQELNLLYEDQQKQDKTQGKELRKLQARFTEVSAELETAKQANKDMHTREDDLKRRMRQLQDQRGDIEGDLLTARAELESARNSGSNQSTIVKAPKVHPETQAEIDRLNEELKQLREEENKLRGSNKELSRANTDGQSYIKILDARIETLKRELDTKDELFAELGLMPDKQGGVTDLHGNTWHGFRNASPLYSELGQVRDQPLHPSLIDARNLQYGRPGIDSAFLKEKVANVNEEIRRRGVSNRKHQHLGSVASHSDEFGGETDTSYSVSETEDTVRQDDQSDIVTNQLMNLSDLLITTSDIAHSNRATPTNLHGESSTPSSSGRSSTPVHVSDIAEGSDVITASDESAQSRRTHTRATSNAVDASTASPVIRATTPTPTHGYGPSPGILECRQERKGGSESLAMCTAVINNSPDEAQHLNLMHVHDSPPSTADTSKQLTPRLDVTKFQNGTHKTPHQISPRTILSQPTTPANRPASKSPRGAPQPSPRTQPVIQSAPSTFRLDPETNSTPGANHAQQDTTPVGKRMTVSKSEKIIRQHIDKNQPKADPSPYKPSAPRQKPEMPRHKSEVSLYNSDSRGPSPGVKNMDSDQVTELHEFALKAGLIRPRTALPKVDKYAQADPSEFEAGAQIEGKVLTASQNYNSTAQRVHRSRSQPSIHKPLPALTTPQRPPQRTPQQTPQQTPNARTAQQSDRRIIVRGNPYLIRLLSYPDPALDDMEEIMKKLEAELDGIEERLNKPSLPLSSSTASTTPVTPSAASSATPSTPSTPITPSTFANSLPAPSFTRRTQRPSPLVVASTPRGAFARTKYWWLAVLGAVGCFVLAIVFGMTKLQLS